MSEPMTTTEYRPGADLPGITLVGGLAGAVAAIAVVILLAPLLLERVSANSFEDGTARVDTVFQFTGLDVELPELITMGDTTLFVGDWTLTPLFMFSLLAAIAFGIAGAITVGLTRWLPTTVDTAAVTSGMNRRLYANGIAIGVVLGILTAQFAATWLGSNTGIDLEIPIFRFLLTLVGAGAILGASVVATTHLIARPDVVGIEGHTWETRSEFASATRRAISVPLVAAAAIAVVVVVFGVLLLESHDLGTAGPLVLASVVSILILAGASYAAYKK
ncbi:MAG: hypothetical protein KJP22_14470 [Acidimicrobiia bacterium]|nr:hypothetical protein [Acidimicrobiia bacterium]